MNIYATAKNLQYGATCVGVRVVVVVVCVGGCLLISVGAAVTASFQTSPYLIKPSWSPAC